MLLWCLLFLWTLRNLVLLLLIIFLVWLVEQVKFDHIFGVSWYFFRHFCLRIQLVDHLRKVHLIQLLNQLLLGIVTLWHLSVIYISYWLYALGLKLDILLIYEFYFRFFSFLAFKIIGVVNVKKYILLHLIIVCFVILIFFYASHVGIHFNLFIVLLLFGGNMHKFGSCFTHIDKFIIIYKRRLINK